MELFFSIFLYCFIFLKIEGTPATTPRSAYNEVEARALLNLAAAAYAPSPHDCVTVMARLLQGYLFRTFLSTTPRILYSLTDRICDELGNNCGSFAFADDVNKHLYIVFRGTTTKAQLLTESWQSLHPSIDFYGIGKAHKYFFTALSALWPDVEQVLTDHKDYGVTFTGHSLGGALASLAALKTAVFNYTKGEKIKLYTFGQPRVGNVELAMKHNQLLPFSFRIVHGVDIVAHLPGCAKTDFLGDTVSKVCNPDNFYKPYHHGLEIFYPHEMRPDSPYFECLGEPIGEDFNCSDKLIFIPEYHFQYTYAHNHYFEHRVSAFGNLGCQATKDQEKKFRKSDRNTGETRSSWNSIVNKVEILGQFLGIGR